MMDVNHKKLALSGMLLLAIPLACTSAYAANAVNLRHQNISALHSFVGATAIKEISRDVDFKKTLHIRIQQTYSGYDVFGADGVVHIPEGEETAKSMSGMIAAAKNKGTMNGIMYQGLHADLAGASSVVFAKANAEKALQHGINKYQQQDATSIISDKKTSLIVYVAKDKKAHWAYEISFYSEPVSSSEKPVKQIYIMDAKTFKIYEGWDDIKTVEVTDVDGGGFGGNIKMGKMTYDGAQGNLAKLMITRDADTETCFLKNSDVIVKNYNDSKAISFGCSTMSEDHNNVYWDADFDKVNDGYSPANDAFFGGQVIKHMYQDWYGVPVLKNSDGKPMVLNMVVHKRKYDNAYWYSPTMTFGDGYSIFYPLTSLGVAAHEISHGFTEQHSNLRYSGQSGGMNEAYSDMAAQAAEVYAYGLGNNSWQIGPEIFKAENKALRYMDMPSKDCADKSSGRCSIDDASQYTDWLDVHYSSGVYNRFFYTLGTTADWDAKKAFDVMVHANSNYWTKTSTFSEGACGVISAATDLGYNVGAVKDAFDVVKVDYSNC